MSVHGAISFKYAKLVYDELVKTSREVSAEELAEFGYPAEKDTKVIIFVGFLNKSAANVGVSASNTRHASNLLTAMRCITRLRGGGLRHSSVYILHYSPTEEAFNQYRESLGMVSRRIAPNKYDALINDFERNRQELKDLRARIERLETLLNVGHDV